MKYYYFHYLNPQFFFPEKFNKHKVFKSFYQPYNFKGFVFWYLFKNLFFIKYFFRVRDLSSFFPYDNILKILKGRPLIAFNLGTKGAEQKITGLGYEGESCFFFKYAITPLSIKNVKNEHNNLLMLSDISFTPNVLEFYEHKNQLLLKTDVFFGKRLKNIKFNEILLKYLFELSNQTTLNSKKNILYGFAHGDFCPWNMISNNNKIYIYDWEMAGEYPLGYDLFTFIFQTSFLINKKKNIQLLLNENIPMINKYFSNFEIVDWFIYLNTFCDLKINSESSKHKSSIINNYNILKNYLETKWI